MVGEPFALAAASCIPSLLRLPSGNTLSRAVLPNGEACSTCFAPNIAQNVAYFLVRSFEHRS